MSTQQPILVTGSHRSGTTWVGRMLALSLSFEYIHEPFNVEHPHELAPRSFNHWYHYAPPDSRSDRREDIQRVLDLRYPLPWHLTHAESAGDVYRHVRRAMHYLKKRVLDRSVLLKDPLALLSAEWLADRFGLKILVMIRHPAGFAGSLKEKGWTFPFGDLLAQDRLMEDHLSPFAEEIETFANTEQNVIDQAALLWSVLYTVVSTYQDRHPEWTFLRHEDVARHPVETFESLYAHFGLNFTASIREETESHSEASGGSNGKLRRDSRAVVRNWEHRLTPSEVERVRRQAKPVASEFYSDTDW